MKISAVLGLLAVLAVTAGALLFARRSGGDGTTLVSVSWEPPKTALAPDYVQATKMLLGNGLGDPRGGRFSKVQVHVGDAAWGRLSVTEGYGWVFPDGKRAVLLDGVEYHNFTSSTPVDLDTTINGFGASATGRRQIFRSRLIPISGPSEELPALLLLVGRADLAEKAAPLYDPYRTQTSNSLISEIEARYQMLAADALIKKDDQSGLEWAKMLTRVSRVQDNYRLAHPVPGQQAPPSLLAENLALVADFQRRLDHPKPLIDVPAILKENQPQRIATLISNLDEVGAKQMSQPGGLDYFQDPIFDALSKQGQDAIPPLIDALETDHRYTRSISFGRDFASGRTIHTVKGAAWDLIRYIWPSSVTLQPDQLTIPDGKVVRAQWENVKNISEPERWLAVLKDDKAGHEKWLKASRFLVKPSDLEWLGDFSYRVPATTNVPMTGEPLRGKSGSEIVRLMSERAEQTMEAALHSNSGGQFEAGDALRIGHCLARWDLAASTDILKKVCTSALDIRSRSNGGNDPIDDPLFIAIADRAKARDSTAAADYAKVLEYNPQESISRAERFVALIEAPHDAAIQAVGEKYMKAWGQDLPSSDTNQAIQKIQSVVWLCSQSTLLTVPSYRRLLASALANVQPMGTAEAQASDRAKYALIGGGGGELNLSINGPSNAVKGMKASFSAGDFLASNLTQGMSKSFPPFHILDPDAKRKQERQAIIAWLEDDHLDWLAIAKTSPFAGQENWNI